MNWLVVFTAAAVASGVFTALLTWAVFEPTNYKAEGLGFFLWSLMWTVIWAILALGAWV